MPSIRRCGHVRMRLYVHTALLPTNEANLPRTSRPVNRSHNTAVNCDRWRRYGAFVASVAERAHHGASYNPLSERTIQNPYPVYARLRQHSPVHRSVILGSWILSRYADVLAVARDHERFSNDPRWRNSSASVLPPAPDDYSILLVEDAIEEDDIFRPASDTHFRNGAGTRVDRRRQSSGAPGQARADSIGRRAGSWRCCDRDHGGSGDVDGVSHQAPIRRRGSGDGVERTASCGVETQAHRA